MRRTICLCPFIIKVCLQRFTSKQMTFLHRNLSTLRHHRQAARRVWHKFQVDECRLYRRVPQPARQVVDGDSVHQQVACVAVAQRVRPDSFPRAIAIAPSSSARFTADCTQRQAVAGCASTILPWADVPVSQRAAKCPTQLRMYRHKPRLAAFTRSHSHRRIVCVERQVRTSRSSDSDTRSPARHCSSISNLAFGLGADLMIAFHLFRFEVFRYWP